jgi:inner membrane protein
LDNVTHALAGMLVAEAVLAWRRESRQGVRAAAYLASAAANNLPDIDLVYTWIPGPKPIGSLVHHRGHTHTLLLALPAAWLLGVWMCRWLSKRRELLAGERRMLMALWLFGPLLHLAMDFGNNYGVHPFWPLSSRWFYGDTIFIVEPLWWAAAIPVLAPRLQRAWLKVLLWVLLGGLLVLCWYVPFVLPASRFVLLGVAALAGLLGARAPARTSITFAVGAWLAIALTFCVGSAAAKTQLERATVAAFPALAIHDIAASPTPANPTCWEALVVGEQGGQYRVLRASVALWPLATERCTAGLDVEPTAPVVPLDRPSRSGVRWIHQYSSDTAELRRLARDDCRFRALLQFARVPYIGKRYAGDLRYDRAPDRDFSDVELPSAAHAGPCPRWLPGWDLPRASLVR